MARRESVGRLKPRSQSITGPPAIQMVTVAVLPPKLPAGFAPPTGLGMADAFSWDESLNWRHNQPLAAEGAAQAGRKKSFRQKIGLTAERAPAGGNLDKPPFVMRQIPHEVWRKHYAKDKDGNYRGTHAPAEDCLLKPEDVEKWHFGEKTTLADKWTRGKEALPVYGEVEDSGRVPEYEVNYDGPPREEPRLASVDEDATESTVPQQRQNDAALSEKPTQTPAASPRPPPGFDPSSASSVERDAQGRVKGFNAPKDAWKKKVQRDGTSEVLIEYEIVTEIAALLIQGVNPT